MSARSAIIAMALAVTSCAPVPQPYRAAVGHEQGVALAAACKGRDGWSDAAPPARIFGNTWYVGTCGITAILLTSPRGHILIDAATAEAAPSILANIRTLGFDPRDVRLIVGTHEHFDHMGGFAALKAATGAIVAVREPARAALESGRVDPADPQSGLIVGVTPVKVDQLITDGEIRRVGSIALTAIATAGHTSGGTSWQWRSCEGTRCLTFAYVDSLRAIAADGYRFSDHPERVAPFRTTFERVSSLKCDVLVTPHPDVSDMFERLAGRVPLVDGRACKRLADATRQKLDDRLVKERVR